MTDGKLYVVGVGPGGSKWLTPAALQIIESSDLLIGGARNLAPFKCLNKTMLTLANNLETVCHTIAVECRQRQIAVLASGDPGIFSIMQALKRRLPEVAIEAVPGISSLQYFCNKLGIAWDNLRIISLHGRGQPDWAAEIGKHRRVCVFTDVSHPPQAICRELRAVTLPEARVAVGENLSYPEERIVMGTPAQIEADQFGGLCLMLLETAAPERANWPYRTPGIPDADFCRDAVPMTKEEIRAVTLAKLRLRRENIVYDIGAGTGSVSVECALLAPAGQVYAIERDPPALKLLAANRGRFGVANLTVVSGAAPEILTGLPLPERVFIGGTGGNLAAIIDWLGNLPALPRVVLNAVTLDSAYQAVQGFRIAGFSNVELVQLTVARSEPIVGKLMLKALNPVFIISAASEVSR
jgi:precorrin-6Y C5,15-methyltransferase (decarboxylating)